MVMRSRKFDMTFETDREYRQVYRRSYQATHEVQKLVYNKRARKFAYNTMARWSKEDIERVMLHTMSDRNLAKELGRSVQAIQGMRYRKLMKTGGIYV